jgi:hypothetical protein
MLLSYVFFCFAEQEETRAQTTPKCGESATDSSVHVTPLVTHGQLN